MKCIKRNVWLGIVAFWMILSGIFLDISQTALVYGAETGAAVSLQSIPPYTGEPYVAVNDNIPGLALEEGEAGAFEEYSSLDSFGRCKTAYANIGQELMPREERGAIGEVQPTGWRTIKYEIVDGNYLYNRCHLIGYQLTGENDNEKNLITGTRYLNMEGMLPFENMVADYIKETGNHVLYRATPVFDGENLVASGVQMEALSVEDNGEGICFNVYCYNVQPGITIDYATGDSWESKEPEKVVSKVYSATSNLNIRSEESTDSDVIGQLAYGDTIEVTSISGDWAAVLYDGATAYAAAAYLTEGEIVPEPEAEAEEGITQEGIAQEEPVEEEAPVQMVWIPNSGSKYHSRSGCSNMKNPTQVPIDQAVNMGYQPCKKCY